MTEITGPCPDRFAAVRAAFERNFTDAPEGLNEVGARFSATIEGETVIDLIGGHADLAGTRPLAANTLVPVFSTGKAVMALLMAWAVERGKLAYDQPVADLWPDFGQAGKERVTVAQLLSHQAGLPGFAESIAPELWFDREAVIDKLAAQAPMWAPGTASGYHPITVGYLVDEVHRRADGRSLGQALREDFAEPFGLDLWIGLPVEQHDRVAEMKKPSAPPSLGVVDDIKRSAFFDRGSSPGRRGTTEWRTAEIPSANLHGTAKDLARIMAVIADGGLLEGRRILSPTTIEAAIKERNRGADKVLPFSLSWAAGFLRNEGIDYFGPGARTVGHYGWGGSCVMADPDARVSAAYVMTRQSPHLIGDPRPVALFDALYSCL